MAKGSLRRYDVQAKVSLYIALVAIFGVLALAALLFRNFKSDMIVIPYSKRGMFAPMVFGVTALTMLLAITAAIMGANSAGQRRNELTRRSWTAFFLGAAIFCFTVILFSVFWFYGLPM